MGQDTEKNKQQSNQGDPGNQQDTSWKQQPGNPKKNPSEQGSGNERDQQDQNQKRRAS
jgi:hypothetical protein